MKFGSFFSALALGICLLASPALAKPHYINGIDANYPPFAFVNEKGEPSGFDIEAMNWIADKMGFTVEHRPMAWDGIIPSLVAKKIDMVCSGMSITDERKAAVNFSDPYWSIKKYLLVKDDSTLTKDELLTGKKTLGVQSGTNEAEYLKKAIDEKGWNYTLKFYTSPPLAIEDLVNGRIAGAAIDSAPADQAMKAKRPIKVVGEFAEGDDFWVAIRKEDKELLETINKGYELLKQDPFWQELQAKYLANN